MSNPGRGGPRRLSAMGLIPKDYVRNDVDMERQLSNLILSASGWRKIFGASADDGGAEISDTDKEIVAVAGGVFADLLLSRSANETPCAALAVDTRPTGPAIAAIMARVLVHKGVDLRYLGISAAPEIMAYVRAEGLDGFVYVSASHNPLGHNGLKFGLSDGGVVGGTDAQALIQGFNKQIQDVPSTRSLVDGLMSVEESAVAALDAQADEWKRAALAAYHAFALEVGTMSPDRARQEEVLAPIRSRAERRRVGVVADFNGSARSVSIDRDLFDGIGVRFHAINESPGAVAHTIVPEGQALEPCRLELERKFAEDEGFLLGYVPDNDGDRGNLVYVDSRTGRARALHAQEVFALACMAELSYLVYSGHLTYSESGRAQQRHAVVVNGPTSLRIDAIAKAFDLQVFRSEVGEANVVNLARDSRNSGFQVRIMGEGSNGGYIAHPASVRDPLNTVLAVLKLLLIESDEGAPGLYEIWCARSGNNFDRNAGISEMLESLPRFVTTDINEPRAVVDIRSTDHVRFKEIYEEIFVKEWDANHEELARILGIQTWEEINYEGMHEVHGFGKTYRSGRQQGGMKILFKDNEGKKLAFVWMRGSGTEPVFRVLADVMGRDAEIERRLLDWHVSIIHRADARVSELVNASR